LEVTDVLFLVFCPRSLPSPPSHSGAPGGGQEIILETGGAITDDMYSEEFGAIVGSEMIYTLILRHKDCDPQGWSKCKACICPDIGTDTDPVAPVIA
jgi:hypothetical protein